MDMSNSLWTNIWNSDWRVAKHYPRPKCYARYLIFNNAFCWTTNLLVINSTFLLVKWWPSKTVSYEEHLKERKKQHSSFYFKMQIISGIREQNILIWQDYRLTNTNCQQRKYIVINNNFPLSFMYLGYNRSDL